MTAEKNIYLKRLNIEHSEFLHSLFKVKEYGDMFEEVETTLEEWNNRLL